ncbi:MAG: tRNA glutamyl-Q(34) synthetase GluQRS [Steroidobacteraceae bacterium]
MNASTETATTVIAEADPGGDRCDLHGAGRFAPSPTGALHLGSLATAAASFLDARHRRSRWLLRIEDLDTARVVPGAADAILRTLEALGFAWDGPVTFQSQRLELYQRAITDLSAAGFAYPCSCTRRDIGATDDVGGYAGTCRLLPAKPGPTSTRFRADLRPRAPFIDRLQGLVDIDASALGDPVIRRRDGLHAYQLAVVVDDADQGITDIVRGSDLLPSTSWQRSLQAALGLPEPSYTHLPLVCEPDGSKLSKSGRTIESPPGDADARRLLWRMLCLLRQAPPRELELASVPELWDWAYRNWRLGALRGVASLPAD